MNLARSTRRRGVRSGYATLATQRSTDASVADEDAATQDVVEAADWAAKYLEIATKDVAALETMLKVMACDWDSRANLSLAQWAQLMVVEQVLTHVHFWHLRAKELQNETPVGLGHERGVTRGGA